MADQTNTSPASGSTPPIAVQTNNVYFYNGKSVDLAANLGSFNTKSSIITTAAPRPRVGTSQVLTDGPSAVVAGVEVGSPSAVVHLPNIATAAGAVAHGAAWVGSATMRSTSSSMWCKGMGQRP